MNPEQVTQIVETIKTLNLNIDSATTVQIVEQITPLIWLYFIKDIALSLFWGIVFVVSVWLIARAIMAYIKEKK